MRKRLPEGRPDFYTVGLRVPHGHQRSRNSAIRSWWEFGIAEELIAKSEKIENKVYVSWSSVSKEYSNYFSYLSSYSLSIE